ERMQQGLDVGVEPPVTLRRGRVPPADDERLETLLDEKLDEAPTRGEVGDVELVHLGRDQEDGALEDLAGLGTVLEQLEHLAPADDRAGRGGQFLPDRERPLVDLRWQTAIGSQVGEEMAGTAPQTCAAGLEGSLDRSRIAQQRIRRCQRLDQ